MTLNVHENVSHVPISVPDNIPLNITSDRNVHDDVDFCKLQCQGLHYITNVFQQTIPFSSNNCSIFDWNWKCKKYEGVWIIFLLNFMSIL